VTTNGDNACTLAAKQRFQLIKSLEAGGVDPLVYKDCSLVSTAVSLAVLVCGALSELTALECNLRESIRTTSKEQLEEHQNGAIESYCIGR
jgi:hypothetical protein